MGPCGSSCSSLSLSSPSSSSFSSVFVLSRLEVIKPWKSFHPFPPAVLTCRSEQGRKVVVAREGGRENKMKICSAILLARCVQEEVPQYCCSVKFCVTLVYPTFVASVDAELFISSQTCPS